MKASRTCKKRGGATVPPYPPIVGKHPTKVPRPAVPEPATPDQLTPDGAAPRPRLDRQPRASGGKLTYGQRKSMPKSEFVFPEQKKYPINDKAHARNALARVSQFGSSEQKSKVRAAVHRKFPDIGK